MNVNQFIMQYLGRSRSLFEEDILLNHDRLLEKVEGKAVLVIGGAGTIGLSFIKALLKFRPRKLVVADTNENGLAELVRDLRSTPNQFIPDELLLYPISYASNTFAKLFKFHAPFEIIANFAAHKHVRSEKDIFSIEALFYNNVINSHVLLEMLTKQPPSHFFCVSTDKAANPVNIMGASKKLMEEIIFAYLSDFKVTTARFANVAFSNGSLMDGFLKRIQKQQPISCPSDVTRFFVSDQEAGEICLMAAIMGNKGEIFFPKLSQENDLINFFDILKAMLKKQGLKPVVFDTEEAARQGVNILSKGEYPIYLFKTDTSGEKLYEEFYTEAEQVNFDQFQALGVIKKNNFYTKDKVKEIMSELTFLLGQENTQKKDIVSWLRSYLLRFDHIETGLSLDKKM